MDFKDWPNDRFAAEALVALFVSDIQEMDDAERDTLVCVFVRAAWPTPRGQRQ
jgi:hypothetical protein